MTTTAIASWADANHAHLVSEFARLKERLGIAASSTLPEVLESEFPFAIDRLVELFGLSSFERDLLLLSAGVEMDSDIAARCAELHGAGSKPYVTFGLAMSVLADPHWSAFTPAAPLRRFRLLDVHANGSFTGAPVRVDERILHYLAGLNLVDPSIASLTTRIPFPELVADTHRDAAHAAARILLETSQLAPVIHLCGDDSPGREDVASLAAAHAGMQLLAIRTEDLPAANADLDRLACLLEREAVLVPAMLLLDAGQATLSQAASCLIEKLQVAVFLATREPVRLRRGFVRFEVNKPERMQQLDLWQRALGDSAEPLQDRVRDISQHFRLSARMIHNTSAIAKAQAEIPEADALWHSCRSLARPKFDELAQRIAPSASWDDLVLPEQQSQMLRQIAAQAWHRMQVYEAWGFASKGQRGLGVSALFCGDSGTGKTLAAEVLAHELGLDLYRVDLASVVSKYIGETEKNLKTIFDAAEEGGVLLLFDEADALFGKRGEVKDSHDRYANIEVGYLLQRMESYAGLAILTTNLKSSLDRAFQRRLRFTVTFPFPDSKQRELIWARVFPAATPTRDLDVRRLAQLNVAGGNIRNIALNAAFFAAQNDTAVSMSHLVDAAHLEAHKLERPLTEAELRGWV